MTVSTRKLCKMAFQEPVIAEVTMSRAMTYHSTFPYLNWPTIQPTISCHNYDCPS